METICVHHPLVDHKITTMRETKTNSITFRAVVEELVMLLAYEATRGLETREVDIVTPVAPARGVYLADPRPMVVPVLRAGLGMLEGMLRLVPTAEVGFVGLVRNEDSLEATTYAERIPTDLSGRQVFVLDPMLATGGTLVTVIESMLERGAKDVTAIVLLAAPEGLARVSEAFDGHEAKVTVVTGAIDERLNDRGYIVPGLGDAGDRLYGVV
ncbi:MAG: uracil phosphoribosyltransferase [Candidatus Nanopelagicales bacterium]|jgi:uracil phosphoribosyltransferase|nr:uracil phosphoribosyltransferase [Candidatus Nanopelagicales bacterium]MDP4826020.1 uracil phosphoribosyltransferase [Candidatus Nanopelagicales bacterium]MDP4888676.1 uracil phosphoribosyltransferase [Candidatus Nanopelagicales bacterium]